ncbi:MAG: ChaN family lipoprotein [Desulforhabdus sp.]|jgi:uncharacterized iron-regulated protein|nr:ChaN family lipoprotein [Desulforhabdus sp.]
MKPNQTTLTILVCLLALASSYGCKSLIKQKLPLTLQGRSQALQPGDIVDTRTGEIISFDKLFENLSKAKVVYVGETHTSIEDHQIQRRILQSLYDGNPQLVVAMEMFPRHTQPVLDRYSSGLMSEQALIEEANWDEIWGHSFQFYRGILTWAGGKQLKILALNAPPEVVRKIGRNGLSSITPQERSLIAEQIDLADSAHKEYVRQEYEQHVKENIKNFESFYEAQLAWEETMAEALAQAIHSNNKLDQLVVLIGKGHIVQSFGVPERTRRRAKHEYATIVPIPIDYPERQIDPALADYVWITKESTEHHHRGMLGVMVTPLANGGGLEIKGVVPNSPAAQAGVKPGDVLYCFDGKPVSDIADIHQALAEGTTATHALGVKRGGKAMKLQVTLSPR